MEKNDVSVEEKIDYIYSRLKRQEKLELISGIIKWSTRLLIVVSIMYFIFIKIPAMKNEIVDNLTPEIPTFSIDTIKNSDTITNLKEKFLGNNSKTTELEEDITEDNFY